MKRVAALKIKNLLEYSKQIGLNPVFANENMTFNQKILIYTRW